MSNLRIAIDFRVDDPRQGVGTAVLALAHGLSRLQALDQKYIFVVTEENLAWLQPHVSGPCSVIAAPRPVVSTLGRGKMLLRRIGFLRRFWLQYSAKAALIPRSDGFLESLQCDVVHFPSQIACITDTPSIYQPWDLQHCHYPEFFAPEERLLRNTRYPAFCRQARFVCIQTEWGKQDLIEQYGLDPARIAVIRWGTAFEVYQPPLESDLAEVRKELNLPQNFFVYPAITWPHKNHALILSALGQLRTQGRSVHVVFTGATTPFHAQLVAQARKLKIEAEVHFLGFVTNRQVQAIYRLATAMIFPSRFEGLGLPVLEAFRVGLPVLCSSATVLPEVAGDAALLFNPDSPAELMQAMERIQSLELRAQLTAAGTRVLKRYSADEAAQEFASLYRATAGEHFA